MSRVGTLRSREHTLQHNDIPGTATRGIRQRPYFRPAPRRRGTSWSHARQWARRSPWEPAQGAHVARQGPVPQRRPRHQCLRPGNVPRQGCPEWDFGPAQPPGHHGRREPPGRRLSARRGTSDEVRSNDNGPALSICPEVYPGVTPAQVVPGRAVPPAPPITTVHRSPALVRSR